MELLIKVFTKRNFALQFLLISIFSCNSPIDKCDDLIYIEEFGDYVPIGTLGDTVENSTNGTIYKIVFTDCFGSMFLVGYAGGSKILEGQYKGESILRIDSIYTIDHLAATEATEKILRTYEYHRPAKTGTWKYWSQDGTLEKEEEY